jgi:hypothetical protein
MVNGINIWLSSVGTGGARTRTGPNDLTRDFVFEGGNRAAVVVNLGGPGALIAGTWQVRMWSWDNDFPTGLGGGNIGPQQAAWRRNGSENSVSMSVLGHPTDPAITFTFPSDGIGTYDVFLRENNTQNRMRINALTLALIPEPSTLTLLLGLLAVRIVRRKRQ